MANDRKDEAIRIIKKYINGNYYAFGEYADVFELFEIDTAKDNEIIKNKIKHLKALFHPDLVLTMPEKYQYVYKYITENLVTSLDAKPTIPYSVYIANKKQSIKDHKKDVERKFITQEQKHKFYYEAMHKLDTEINEYNREVLHKKTIEELSEDLEKLNNLINNYMNLPKNKIRNVYEVFNISNLLTLDELLENDKYLEIEKLLNIKYNYYQEVYGNVTEQNIAYNDLKYLYKKCKDEYFVSQESKNRYDLELKEKEEKKINIDEVMSVLMKCTTRLINDNKKELTYFDIFGLDINKSNDLILASKDYAELLKTFDEECIKYIPKYYKEPFMELYEKFNDFNLILHDEEERNKYEKFYNTKEVVSIVEEDNNEITINRMNKIINKYQKYYEDSTFVNYYELFDLPINVNSEMLKNSLEFKLLKNTLNHKNIELLDNVKDTMTFEDLCSMFKNFEDVILSDEEKKAQYDEKVKVRNSNNTMQIKYREVIAKESSRFEKVRDDYYKTFEYLLLKNGASKTIKIITLCLNNETFSEDKDIESLLTDYNTKQVIKFLQSDFGRKDNEELVEDSFCRLMTKKIEILRTGVVRTYVKYDIEQVKKAITTYVENGDPVFFTSGDKNNIGRGKIAKEIPQDLIKIILGCIKQNELGFLMDDVNNNYDLIKNNGSIDILVSELLKTYLNTNNRKRA